MDMDRDSVGSGEVVRFPPTESQGDGTLGSVSALTKNVQHQPSSTINHYAFNLSLTNAGEVLETIMKVMAGTGGTPPAASPSVLGTTDGDELPDFSSYLGTSSQTALARMPGSSGTTQRLPPVVHLDSDDNGVGHDSQTQAREDSSDDGWNNPQPSSSRHNDTTRSAGRSVDAVVTDSSISSGEESDPPKKRRKLSRSRRNRTSTSRGAQERGSMSTQKKKRSGMCFQCEKSPPNYVLSCKHVYCEDCCKKLHQKRRPCPRCGMAFRSWSRVYL